MGFPKIHAENALPTSILETSLTHTLKCKEVYWKRLLDSYRTALEVLPRVSEYMYMTHTLIIFTALLSAKFEHHVYKFPWP